MEILNDHQPFLYKLVGTWAFSPHPARWRELLTWFRSLDSETFDPYVPGLVTSDKLWSGKVQLVGLSDTVKYVSSASFVCRSVECEGCRDNMVYVKVSEYIFFCPTPVLLMVTAGVQPSPGPGGGGGVLAVRRAAGGAVQPAPRHRGRHSRLTTGAPAPTSSIP